MEVPRSHGIERARRRSASSWASMWTPRCCSISRSVSAARIWAWDGPLTRRLGRFARGRDGRGDRSVLDRRRGTRRTKVAGLHFLANRRHASTAEKLSIEQLDGFTGFGGSPSRSPRTMRWTANAKLWPASTPRHRRAVPQTVALIAQPSLSDAERIEHRRVLLYVGETGFRFEQSAARYARGLGGLHRAELKEGLLGGVGDETQKPEHARQQDRGDGG